MSMPTRPRNGWWYVGVAAAVVGNLLLWSTAALVGLGLMLEHVTTTVYADDFTANSGELPAFDDANGTGRYRDGAYWLTVKTPGLHYVGVSFAARDVVDVRTTVSLTAPARATDMVGVRAGSDGGGYVFSVTAIYLDGREVLRVADPTTWHGLSSAGVAAGGDTAPVTARFDDVAVRTGFTF